MGALEPQHLAHHPLLSAVPVLVPVLVVLVVVVVLVVRDRRRRGGDHDGDQGD